MEKLLNYFLKIILVVILIGFVACQQAAVDPYQKVMDPAEHKAFARNLKDGIFNYYQGSPATQMILREALSYDSTNADIYREIGVPYLKRGLAKEFFPLYENAVKYNAVDWQGWRGYLYLYFYRDYERAIADFDATDILTPDIVDYPQSMSVDFMRGICYLKLGKYEKSLEYFDKQISYETETNGLDYIDCKTFLYKGIAHLELQDTLKAIRAFDIGLSIDSKNANLLYWRSKLHYVQGEKYKGELLLADANREFAMGNHNTRAYVEEFYQLYLSDIEELKLEHSF